MKPGVLDIDVYRGDYFELFFRLRAQDYDAATDSYVAGAYLNLTSWTVSAQIRDANNTQILASFTAAIGNQTTYPGSVLLSIPASATATLAPGKGLWDVQLTNTSSQPRTYLAGSVTIIADVTR